jgi:hypothetical protein
MNSKTDMTTDSISNDANAPAGSIPLDSPVVVPSVVSDYKNIVENGTFSEPNLSTDYKYGIPSIWMGTVGGVSIVKTGCVTWGMKDRLCPTSQFIALQGMDASVAQTVKGFTVGRTYKLSFHATKRIFPSEPNNNELEVAIVGTDMVAGHGNFESGVFKPYEHAFVAKAASHELRFKKRRRKWRQINFHRECFDHSQSLK